MAEFITTGSYVPSETVSTASINDELIWFTTYFRPHFEEWVFSRIDRLINTEPLIGFIFMSCVIDYLSGFMIGGESTGISYTDFIKKYFPPGKYNSKELYKSLRCGLVHSFTINGRKYVLTDGHPERHLKKTTDGQVILNASDFRDALFKAANDYFDAVITTPSLLINHINRYNDLGFLDFGPITIKP